MVNVGIITMGCPKNLVDSEKLAAQLIKSGCYVEHEQINADIIIINTCAFINDAKEESINEILKHTERKKADKNLKVFVIGCLAQRYFEELKTEIPEVDGFFKFNEIDNLIKEVVAKPRKNNIERFVATPKHYAYLKISEGCDRTCSFCAIPQIRGKHISIPEEILVEETKLLAKNGVKELIVIAQDTVSYGIGIYGERRIAKLLRKISEIEGIEWIRLMYTYPMGFSDELIEEIATNKKIVKYIDLPLQHINSEILERMKRGSNKENIEILISKLRNRIPNIAIRSTFIVGYPGEKSSDFLELANFIKQTKFERLGIFSYSPEEGTNAFIEKDNVTEHTKMKRMSDLLRIHEQNCIEFNKSLIGKKVDVIIDEYSKEENCFLGRMPIDAPEIDNFVRLFASDISKCKIGDIVNAKVISYGIFEIDCEL